MKTYATPTAPSLLQKKFHIPYSIFDIPYSKRRKYKINKLRNRPHTTSQVFLWSTWKPGLPTSIFPGTSGRFYFFLPSEAVIRVSNVGK